MLTIRFLRIATIADNFLHQGPRYRKLGPNSGEEFRDDFLIPFLESLGPREVGVVDFSGTEAFSPSFLEEAFGGAIRKGYGDEVDKLSYSAIPLEWKEELKRYVDAALGRQDGFAKGGATMESTCKYGYDDVLTEKDVLTGKVDMRSIIGKLGWFADDMSGCLCEAEEESPCRLRGINDTSNVPFVNEWFERYQYFMPSKQQPEEEDDATWQFGCDADGKVGVLMYHDEDRQTCFMRFNDLTYKNIPERDYKKIKGHLEPFDISDISVRTLLDGKRITHEDIDIRGRTHTIDACIYGFELVQDSFMRIKNGHVIASDMRLSPSEMLDKWLFAEGGTPCGVVVEDKEERP